MIALLLAAASASTDAHDTAILVNPHGPILALVGNAFGLRSLDMNLRAHQVFTPRLGITAQVDASTATLSFFRSTHLGARIGPRFALRRRGLNDWALSPFAVVGVTTLSSKTSGRLARWAVLGAGIEGGRTWVWRRVTFELGLGLYSTGNVAYTSRAEGLEGARPQKLLPIYPVLNGSIGYAW